MTTDLRARYQPELDLVSRIMSDEVTQVPWTHLEEVEKIIRDQMAREGKLARPLLALAVADALGARLDRVCAPAASLEFCYLAGLVLNDARGTSAERSDAPDAQAADAAATASMAINIASTIRSLAYHPIHRAETLGPGEKLSLHRELDRAATEHALGQSIDVGWHLGWYRSFEDFPYDQMIRWKTGSMFGCAAAMGARLANARPGVVEAARHIGGALGSLHQMIDDYLDVFGDEEHLQRPKYQDFRDRKMTGPVIVLLRALTSAGSHDDAERVAAAFSAGAQVPDWDWLAEMMGAHGVGEQMRGQFADQAKSIETQMSELSAGGDGSGLGMVLDLVVTPLQLPAPANGPAPGN